MSSTVERYDHVDCRKREGAHYTPTKLSGFVANKILEKAISKEKLVIADPAIGDGELILSLLENIGNDVEVEVYGFDINADSIEFCQNRILQYFPNVTISLIHGDFLDYCLKNKNEIDQVVIPKFDLIIANPPYIRTQVLGAEQAQLLAKNFGLKGRVDIYQAFLVGMSQFLADDGIAGVIVSNRFLTTKGTGELRKILYKLYNIFNIWDFGDTKLFEAAVLPAVLLFSKRSNETVIETSFSSIYETVEKNSPTLLADSPVEAISEDGVVKCSNGKSYIVKQGVMAFDAVPKDIWRIQDQESEAWLNHVKSNTWSDFDAVGKIRVGVKTTADNVFIKQNWLDDIGVVPELIKPLITHHVAGRFKQASNSLKGILYTHEIYNGKKQAINIDKYPLSKKYLEKHRAQLEGRNYVIKAKRNWYEMWVPQDPKLWEEKKVIFRDISEEPTFWFDDSNSIVNGDCYWMVKDNDSMDDDVLWLILAVANSKFIEKFYDIKFNNKLYSNKRRFISQYVEKFPLPDPQSDISIKMIELAKNRYNESNISKSKSLEFELNNLVWEAFDLPVSD